MSDRLELLMVRFRDERRIVGQQFAATTGWPEPVQTLWEGLLGELEQDLARPDAAELSRRMFLRARVTTEVERDLTERRFGPAPDEVSERISKLHQLISTRMRASLERDTAEGTTSFGSDSDKVGWPVTPVIITSFFGLRRDPVPGEERVRFHSGIDLGGARGDLVYSAAPGRVLHAGWWGGYGRAVVVQHARGFETVYGHLDKILVVEGCKLDAGSPVGQVGSSGRSTGPHLHFEVRQWGVPINPLEAIGTRFDRIVRSEPPGVRN
jgi:murein DD-endopeptidase MepM/ murein hydrolase activator NlpD